MENHMNNISFGPWVNTGRVGYATFVGNKEKDICAVHNADTDEGRANSALIVEAGTVYHETGMTPRQLVEQRDNTQREFQKVWDCAAEANTKVATLTKQRDELLEACVAALAEIEATGKSEGVFFGADKEVDAKLRAAIANAKAGAS